MSSDFDLDFPSSLRIRIGSSVRDSWASRASYALDSGNYSEAIKLASVSLFLGFDVENALTTRSHAKSRLGLFPEAFEDATTACQIYPYSTLAAHCWDEINSETNDILTKFLLSCDGEREIPESAEVLSACDFQIEHGQYGWIAFVVKAVMNRQRGDQVLAYQDAICCVEKQFMFDYNVRTKCNALVSGIINEFEQDHPAIATLIRQNAAPIIREWWRVKNTRKYYGYGRFIKIPKVYRNERHVNEETQIMRALRNGDGDLIGF